MVKETSSRPLATTVLREISPRFSWYQRFCELQNSKFRIFEAKRTKPNPRTRIKRTYQGRNIWDDPIIEKSQDQDQGQGQDQIMRQRSALQQQMVLVLTLILVLRFFNYRVVPDIQSLITSLHGLPMGSCLFLLFSKGLDS